VTPAVDRSPRQFLLISWLAIHYARNMAMVVAKFVVADHPTRATLCDDNGSETGGRTVNNLIFDGEDISAFDEAGCQLVFLYLLVDVES